MKAGAAQIDITPPAGIELSGFVAREQPSIGINDPLLASALYLDDEAGGNLLWINADVIGFEPSFCDSIRNQLAANLGLSFDQVIVSATHTHSGPPTITLNNCGMWQAADETYRESFEQSLIRVGSLALQSPVCVRLRYGHADCDINHDRRGKPSAHVDQRCSVVGVQKDDGSFLAVLANYPCHPVALGGENRYISGDVFGYAARQLSADLSGHPTVLFTNGACGNLNPPDVGVESSVCEKYGRRIAKASLEALSCSEPIGGLIQVAASRLEIKAEMLDHSLISKRAEFIRSEIWAWNSPWSERAIGSVAVWESWMREGGHTQQHIDLRVHVVRIGPLNIVCIGAEAFSILGEQLRAECGEPLFIVGYANGEMGYLCPDPTYDEGGYEVASAYVYYNSPPVKRGEFEAVAQHLARMIRNCDASGT